jgi:hypothetical protein
VNQSDPPSGIDAHTGTADPQIKRAVMQNGTKRIMRTRRHGPDIGQFSGNSKGSDWKLGRPVGVRCIDAKGSYERFMALARTAGLAGGDPTEIENYYQHAEHYFRVMKERAV